MFVPAGVYRVFFLLGSSYLAWGQANCLSQDPLDHFMGTVGTISLGPEGGTQPYHCIQRMLVPQGQKYVSIQTVEYKLLNHSICLDGVEEIAEYCTSSYVVLVSPGSAATGSAFSITQVTAGIGTPAGDWEQLTGPPASDGTLWRRKMSKVYDVGECAATQDCEIMLEVLHSGSEWREVQKLEFYYSGYFRFMIHNTPSEFVPEAIDGPNSSESTYPGKEVTYGVFYDGQAYQGDDPLLYPKGEIQFELSLPVNAATYRPGQSGNMGIETAQNATPDYLFLPEGPNAGLSIVGQTATTDDAVEGANVTVTSKDYGGVALLRARMRFGDEWFYAEPVPVEGRARADCAVAATDKRGFVQIPIDVDCNWIADSWEVSRAPAAVGGVHFPRYWDGETTGSPAVGVTPGDGFGAYDEYRGFSTVTSSGDQLHRRTDPAKLTAFYHDKSGSGIIKDSLADLLIPQLSSQIEFHEIAADQFTTNGALRSFPLNRNSAAPTNLRNYALVFVGLSSHPECQPSTIYGSAGSLGKSDLDIAICLDRIDTEAGGGTTNLARTARAVITAHEVGHRFNLRHYSQDHAYHANKLDSLASVTALNGFDPQSPKYIESASNAQMIYAKVRYISEGGSGLVFYNAVDEFDLFLYSSLSPPEEDTALSGFVQPLPSTLIDTPSPPPTGSAQLGSGVAEMIFSTSLSTAGAKYKSPARLMLYDRTKIMSHRFLFQIAEPVIAQYSMADLLPFIQLQK